MTVSIQQQTKRFIDFFGALILILLTMPLWILIALAIKLEDRGSIFFRQERLGRDAKVFQITKFRSMIENADSLVKKDGSVSENRVTTIGALLRKSSLDELPQLLNILVGDMSFIGPRPALTSHLPRYTAHQKKRLAVRPGLTGLAQVKGRNTLPWSKRIRYDIFYIEKFSLAFDIAIALMTLQVVVSGTGVVLDRNPGEVDDLAPAPHTPE